MSVIRWSMSRTLTASLWLLSLNYSSIIVAACASFSVEFLLEGIFVVDCLSC